MTKRTAGIVGSCGEHYVAAYLSSCTDPELVVALPRGGTRGFDLFVSNQRGGLTVRIQVKTGTQALSKTKEDGAIYLWRTSYAVIERNDKELWYAFVWLKGWPHEEALPEVFFVPAKIVIRCLKNLRERNAWSCFWLPVHEANQYRGRAGLKLLVRALGKKGRG